MIYKTMAIEDLKLHEKRKMSIQNLREKIEALECEKSSLRGTSDSVPVMGGDINRQETKIVNAISEQERLRIQLQSVAKHVNRVERALNSLTENERLVLDRFYINGQKDCIARLQNDLGYEKAHIYRVKDKALYDFTIALYGICEL